MRWCASTPGLITACLLSIMTAHNYPTPTHSNTWAWCVTKISIWSLWLMQRWNSYGWHFQSKKVVQEVVLTNRLHAHIWLLKTYATAIPASMYASQIWLTPFFKQGKEMDNPVQKWLLTVLKRILNVRDTHYSFLVRYARVWPWAAPTIQLVSCHNASLQFSDPMQQMILILRVLHRGEIANSLL